VETVHASSARQITIANSLFMGYFLLVITHRFSAYPMSLLSTDV